MTLKRIVAPAESAVSLQELKDHLGGVAADTYDADLQLKLDAAIAMIEGELSRCFVTSTFDMHLDCWPCRSYIEVPLGNLQSVAWIKYTDSAGDEHTVDASAYKLARTYAVADSEAVPAVLGDGSLDAGIGRIYLAPNRLWPAARLDSGEPIVIRFTCGWEDAASVPTEIKQAILMLAAYFYRNRDAELASSTGSVGSAEIAFGVQRLTSRFEDRRW